MFQHSPPNSAPTSVTQERIRENLRNLRLLPSPRLLILSGAYPDMPCGVANHTRLVAQRTAATNQFHVAVLTSDHPAITTTDQPQGYDLLPLIPNWRWRDAPAIADIIANLQPDVLHIQNPSAAYPRLKALTLGRLARQLRHSMPNLRIVVTQHDLAVSHPLLRRRHLPLLQAAHAIGLSNARDEQAARDLGLPDHKLYRAPLPAYFNLLPRTPDSRAASRQALNLPPDATILATFGFVQPSRHIHNLLHALAQLHQQGRPLHLLILGGPFPHTQRYFEKCQQLAQKLNLTQHTTFTGFATPTQIAQGLAAADLFTSLPHRGADLRNSTILAALQAQLPIITTINPRYYTDPELANLTPHLVPPGQIPPLTNAITKLLNNPPLPETLAQIAQPFTPEQTTTQHINANLHAYTLQP